MGHERHDHDHHDHESPRGPRGMRGQEGRHGDHWGDGGGRGRWGGDRGGWGGGRRMRRGDIRKAILSALHDHPAHGYEVMRHLEEMSGGLWRPSPGSVYPHLQMLEDEGMVQSDQHEGTRTFQLTDEGIAEAAKDTQFPWQSGQGGDDEILGLRQAVSQLMGAAKQLSGAGENTQIQRGVAVIQKARKELYQILAED
ncbi:MAG TPA: PadR family transcriptional regulator [Acidimicrobiales bacterium]|nr:PadR family transcriptional regulator [Acidimicrobiales bacterium]